MKHRTEITIETERMVFVTRNGKHRQSFEWCVSCAGYVDMITIDAAAMLARVNSRTIFRWAESGRIHFSETPHGLLLVCPKSLPQN